MPSNAYNNPTYSLNLSGITDYGANSPFLDIARTMRPVFGHEANRWGGRSHEELRSEGFLDANGYATGIPPGVTRLEAIWDWNASPENAGFRQGTYVMTYEGEGDITFVGPGINVISREPGRIVFENTTGRTMSMQISAITAGDHPRDISIFKAQNEGLVQAGALFDPAWLDIVKGARDFRFMDWAVTNDSTLSKWADRPTMDTATWSENGVPLEVMVRLANEAGANPWFTIPHLADEAYIREMAAYVRDNLDPRLEARFELSNEVWNSMFDQMHHANAAANSMWGSAGRPWDYHAIAATKAAALVKEVFAEAIGPAPEAVNVLGTHPGNSWITGQLIAAEKWKQSDPRGWIDPRTVFDEVATTTYFGGATISEQSLRTELLQQIKVNPVAAQNWLYTKLISSDYPSSIPQTAAMLQEQKNVAAAAGLKLVAYEGGQHVHHMAGTNMTQAEADALASFMRNFVRSDYMADLYVELASRWAGIGDGAFMQFGDVTAPTQWGSWGILSHMRDTNPRAEALFNQIAHLRNWFSDEGGDQYLEGVVERGTTGNDTLNGTNHEDMYSGGDGDDRFVVRLGDDRVNGEAGTDVVVIPGLRAGHVITRNPDGTTVIAGSSGRKTLVGVEAVQFDDGTVNLASVPDTPGPAAFQGTLVDAAGQPYTARDQGQGLVIAALDPAGATAAAIGGAPAYSISVPGRSAVIAGETVQGGYWPINHNRAGSGGPLLGSTALGTALLFADIVQGAASIEGSAHDDVMTGGAAAERFQGGAGNDRLEMGDGNDTARGGTGNDSLHGGGGNDLLYGNDGKDTLRGGAGNDQLIGGAGDDILDGGAGIDEVNYMDSAAMVNVELALQVATGDGFDDLSSIENVRGSRYGDRITGDSEVNLLRGMDGNDTLLGQQGNDTLQGGAGDDMLYGGGDNDRLFAGTGINFVDGGAGVDDLDYVSAAEAMDVNLAEGYGNSRFSGNVQDNVSLVENVRGSRHDDILRGDRGANLLMGNGGNDVLHGDAGNDNIQGGDGNDTIMGDKGNDRLRGGSGNDSLSGGAGVDEADYSAATEGVRVNLKLRSGSSATGREGTDVLDGIENIRGSNADDVLAGDTQANLIIGNAGNDRVEGWEGDDSLQGGNGNDSLYGGSGNDFLIGGDGSDVLHGGEGRDTASWSNSGSGVLVNLSTGRTDRGAAGDTLSQVENLQGSNHDDDLVGDAGANDLRGLAGEDNLEGGDGNDTLRGGEGGDVMIGGNGKDRFIFDAADAGLDLIRDFGRDDIIDLADLDAGFSFHQDGHSLVVNHSGGSIYLLGLTQADIPWINIL